MDVSPSNDSDEDYDTVLQYSPGRVMLVCDPYGVQVPAYYRARNVTSRTLSFSCETVSYR